MTTSILKNVKQRIGTINQKKKSEKENYSLLSYSNISKSKFIYFLSKIHFPKSYHLTISLYLVSDI